MKDYNHFIASRFSISVYLVIKENSLSLMSRVEGDLEESRNPGWGAKVSGHSAVGQPPGLLGADLWLSASCCSL